MELNKLTVYYYFSKFIFIIINYKNLKINDTIFKNIY